MQITNIKKNCLGTISFEAKFHGMRKAQDFIVYPINDVSKGIIIQSDNRIGMIAVDGRVVIAKAQYVAQFDFAPKTVEQIDNIQEFLSAIRKTSGVTGTHGVTVDNTAAAKI